MGRGVNQISCLEEKITQCVCEGQDTSSLPAPVHLLFSVIMTQKHTLYYTINIIFLFIGKQCGTDPKPCALSLAPLETPFSMHHNLVWLKMSLLTAGGLG